MKTELPLAIQQLQADTAKFLFVKLRPCGWQRTLIAEYQQTDDPAKPGKNVISISEPDNDAMWNRVINELETKMGV